MIKKFSFKTSILGGGDRVHGVGVREGFVCEKGGAEGECVKL